MKELSIEEKAKHYDEALERAKDFQKVNGPAGSAVISEIFPELVEKESKDEHLRKNCIHFLELQKSHHAATFEIEECIDWLEKQKEPEDKGEIQMDIIPLTSCIVIVCYIMQRSLICCQKRLFTKARGTTMGRSVLVADGLS